MLGGGLFKRRVEQRKIQTDAGVNPDFENIDGLAWSVDRSVAWSVDRFGLIDFVGLS